MIVIPGALIACGVTVFSRPHKPGFVSALLLLFLYQAWHFGAQNMGMASFISLSERSRPLMSEEKLAIKLGTVTGMLGVLRAMSPGYMIGANYVPVGPGAIHLIEIGYDLGRAAAVLLTGVALWFAARVWRENHLMAASAIFLSVTFLFPMYLTHDYLLGFLSFATAHGLQYLIFLATHSMNPDRRSIVKLRPPFRVILAPTALVGVAFLGHTIWRDAPKVRAADFPSIGIAIVLSLTLVHFWLDQFLWRMKSKERAGWIRSRYGYVLGCTTPKR
jgi:hypothetical protein